MTVENAQRAQKTLGKIFSGNSDYADDELNEAYEFYYEGENRLSYGLGTREKLDRAIEKRRDKNANIFAYKNLFWQKWGVIITVFSLVVAIMALAVALLPYLPK
jgi:hypothetical protein